MTLEGWAKAVELRDEGTGDHIQRVAQLTVRIARATGMTDEELVHMRQGALLHDIGKLGVPDSILLKPGVLTDEERGIIQRHTTYAFEMLVPIAHLR